MRIGASSIASTLTSASIAPLTAANAEYPALGLRYRKPDTATIEPSRARVGSAARIARTCPQNFTSKNSRNALSGNSAKGPIVMPAAQVTRWSSGRSP